MKVGFASLVGLPPIPLEESVAWAAANGLQGMEVNIGPGYPVTDGQSLHGHLDLDRILADGPESTRALFDDNGIELTALAPMINLLTSDDALRAERIAYMTKTIDAAAALGCPTIVTFTGSGHGMHFYGLPGVGDGHPSNKVPDNLARFTEVYGPLAEHAEAQGIRIAFETAGRGGGEGNLAHNPELWEAMFDAVPSPALGLSFDPSHLLWLGIDDIPGLIHEFADRIYHVDGKDAEIVRERLRRQGILGSSWWRYRLPGNGELDWPAIVAALRGIGYDGTISIEQEDDLDPGYDAVARSARYLHEVLGE
jgi:sugar phosphate isomerase/epimerase